MYVDIVIENALKVQNLFFRTSFHVNIGMQEPNEGTLLPIVYDLGQGLATISTLDYVVSGYRVYQMGYNNGLNPLKWFREGTLLQGELNYTGGRSALPATFMPYGFGLYVVQNDTRITGRSGKLILKVGFWEQMVSATYTKWKLEPGVGLTEFNASWNSLQDLTTGKWGKYYDAGSASDKMVNLHKGTATGTNVTSMTIKSMNKYRLPRPRVD